MLFLGLNTNGGGNYATYKKRISNLNLDTSHWTGMAWSRGKKTGIAPSTKRPTDEILQQGSGYQSHKLKNRLLKEGLLQQVCVGTDCQIKDTWLGKPIFLHLDRINGDKEDNRLENLRLLCPNCHSQTDTYCGKNKKKSTP